jgi:Core-2/I-Branching enzyme
VQIVFLILAHKNPEQVIRLIERLESSQSRFVVHVDRRSFDAVHSVISDWAANRTDVILAARHRCYWGDFGIVAGTLECVRTALTVYGRFDYGMLLSGQDYPIKPLSSIFDYLTITRGKQFIESFRLDETQNRWTTQSGQFEATARYSWYIARFRSRRLPIPIRRSLPAGLKPCAGCQWWCLTREALEFVSGYLDKSPKALRFFKHVSIPDETVFQTVLYSSPFQKDVISDDMHYSDWDRPNPLYPRVFEEADLEQLRATPKLFARKFDITRGTGIFDLIDRELLSSAPRSRAIVG